MVGRSKYVQKRGAVASGKKNQSFHHLTSLVFHESLDRLLQSADDVLPDELRVAANFGHRRRGQLLVKQIDQFDKRPSRQVGIGAVAVFQREYQAAVDWMLGDPEAAGQLVETELPQLGLEAPILTASLESITWRFTPAGAARPYLERFYTNLAELSPEVIGGRLPDDAFYYVP